MSEKIYVRKLNRTQPAQPDSNKENIEKQWRYIKRGRVGESKRVKNLIQNNMCSIHTSVLKEHLYTSP